MPVIPHNMPPFEIHPPGTLDDDGTPSESLRRDAERVFALIRDERHLSAEQLLVSVRERLAAKTALDEESERSKGSTDSKKKGMHFFHTKKDREEAAAEAKRAEKLEELAQVRKLLESERAALDKLTHRCRLFRRVQDNLKGENQDWVFASKHFGISTYYRKEPDGSLTCKLEGEMHGCPLFEQICVLKEVDLHHRWSPFCTSSMTIADLDKLDVVGWFMVGLPNFGLARDGCFRAIGCDNSREDGSILLTGIGVQDVRPGDPPPEDDFLSADPIIEQLDIPPVPKRRGCGRVTIRNFEAMINITSPSSAETKVIANVNPNFSFLPQSLLEFIMKQLAGVVLAKLQDASLKAMKHPVKNPHARKIREAKEFYQEWLLPKFEYICEMNRWDIPRIAALEISDEQLQHERNLKPLRRGSTFNGHEERIVVNMATVSNDNSEEEMRAHSDDEVSSLSGTLSLWSKNPIAAYLRETEIRVQQRKNEEIADARRKAAARLVPKSFRASQKTRLNELKEAKNRRVDVVGPTMGITDSDTYQEILSISQRFSRRLHRHGPPTRFIVMSFLVSILFLMLHPEPYLHYVNFSERDFNRTAWFVLSLQDVGVVAYIFACAVPFFLVCDVALVYVFDTLELGSKTGRQIKRFYSDNVRFAVAIGSFGVVAASILKAAIKVWLRCVLWCLAEVYGFLNEHVFFRIWLLANRASESLPEELQSATAVAWSYFDHIRDILCAGTKYVVGVPSQFAYRLLLQSNFIGRKVEGLLIALVRICIGVARRSKGFVVDSIDAFEGKLTLVSWRAEAFNTARSLFSYAAVFLLTLLILFSASAKRSRRSSGKESRRQRLNSELSSISEDSSSHEGRPKSVRGLGLQATPISEDEVYDEKTDGTSALREFTPDSSKSASNGKKSGRLLRFRRGKTFSNGKKSQSDPGLRVQENDRTLHTSKTM